MCVGGEFDCGHQFKWEVRVGCLRLAGKEKQSVRNLLLKLKRILFPQKTLLDTIDIPILLDIPESTKTKSITASQKWRL